MKRSLALVTIAFSSTLAFAACSSSSKETGPSTAPTSEDAGEIDSSTSSSSSSSGSSAVLPDAGPGDQSCSTLAQAGSAVDVVAVKSAQPEATGGTPSDGTYVLKSVHAFTTLFPDGYVVQTFGAYTLIISDGTKTFEQVVTNKDGVNSRAKGALVADGTSFTATPSCETPLVDGGVQVISGKYTADATSLKMYVVRDFGITAELAFEKN